MANSPGKNVKRLVDTTKTALAKKPRHLHVRGGHYLAGHSTTLEIYGEDAARDFIETKWAKMFEHLIEMADSQQTSATVNIPQTGIKAGKTIVDYIRDSLPGCEIWIEGCSMNIDWAKLVEQAHTAE